MFQFQNGAINGLTSENQSPLLNSFNSKMVQLMACTCFTSAIVLMFQFQNGAINGRSTVARRKAFLGCFPSFAPHFSAVFTNKNRRSPIVRFTRVYDDGRNGLFARYLCAIR
jgi:hypothetical protein